MVTGLDEEVEVDVVSPVGLVLLSPNEGLTTLLPCRDRSTGIASRPIPIITDKVNSNASLLLLPSLISSTPLRLESFC